MKKDILKKKKTDFGRPQQKFVNTNNELKPIQMVWYWDTVFMYREAINYIERRKMYAITKYMQEK